MSTEPTLESIEDYNTLKGEKKRVVWTVIIVGLIIGAALVGLKVQNSHVSDEISGAKDSVIISH
ncbi:MAG: hypothetical protein U9N42_05780 [Campylobacterota bacterium]|nr:hypothetical protein [Campylobacterota bacterium]